MVNNNDQETTETPVQGGATSEATVTIHDYPWATTGANWFLISIAAALRDNWLMSGNLAPFLGAATAVMIGAAIPVTIVYLSISDKKAFRWRRAMTIAGWCVLGIMFYPVIRDFLFNS